MCTSRLPSRSLRALIIAAVAAACSVAVAAPYAVNYQGNISSSDFPEITVGESYTLTLVFDNGGTSANSQTWGAAHLTCAIWRMNNARNVVYAQNLVATPPSTVTGSATTNGAGGLTGMFSSVSSIPGDPGYPAGSFTSSGISLTAPVHWFANSLNGVFYDALGGTQNREFSDAAGGVIMNPANWSAPTPFSGSCSAAPSAVGVAPVPTLGEWGLGLLGLAAAGLGAQRLRRRR